MGQYYLVVNVTKTQYLHPHKFGQGLKLMEFSGAEDSIAQALLILLSNGNGNGGGDMDMDKLDDAERKLIGSWAGDQIVVAGDYGEPWKWVDSIYHGKTYENAKGEKVAFGFRPSHKKGEFYPETLFSAALTFFDDISDKIIKVIVKAEGRQHPLSKLDLSKDGFR